MIESCCRTGSFLPTLTRPPPVAPLETVGFCGARKISAAPPVMSRTMLPPPVMSWAVTLGHACEAATAKPKKSTQKRRFLMQLLLLRRRLQLIPPTYTRRKPLAPGGGDGLIERVELETNRIGACCLQTIHNSNDFAVPDAALGFNEDCLLNP